MKNVVIITTTAFVAMVIAIACTNQQAAEKHAIKPGQDSLVKRGEYLVTIMGCDDCHSPKVFGPNGPSPDMSRRLSGHPADMPVAPTDGTALSNGWVLFNGHTTAIAGPWGISFGANLTSDETGIGSWTEAQFFKAIREGKSKGIDGARMLLPPMPWPNYAKAKDADLKAIFAYLKSTTPIKNIVPAPIPPHMIAKKG